MALEGDERDMALRHYFACFPKSFADFNRLYGYRDAGGELAIGPLYDEHLSHIREVLPSARSVVADREYNWKLARIASEGRWDADAVGFFQTLVIKLIKDVDSGFMEHVDTLPREKIAGLWEFVFDSPHGINPSGRKINASVCEGIDGKACSILRELLADWRKNAEEKRGHPSL